jgi:putative ABC transport system substrate-binding protein
MLTDATAPTAEIQVDEVQEAARAIGLQLLVVKAGTEGDIDAAFATLVQQGAGALLVGASALFNVGRAGQIVALAARYRMPAVYLSRYNAVAGGLLSYGTDYTDSDREVGTYTGRILKGAKPADLPVVQSTKFELVVNLQTARALGLEVPSGLLAIADEVIE